MAICSIGCRLPYLFSPKDTPKSKRKKHGKKQHKTVKFRQNPFYDDVLIVLFRSVPSKRVGYKQNENKQVTEIYLPKGTQDFEKEMREHFTPTYKSNWPHKGNLLMVVWLALPKREYEIKDIDNMAKSIIDSLKGTAYDDDTQISSLFVHKYISEIHSFMIGIKKLTDKDKGYFPPELYSAVKPQSPSK